MALGAVAALSFPAVASAAPATVTFSNSTLAAAYQIIYAADQPGLSRYQIQSLNHVHSPNPIPVITPAINNSGDPAQLTENSGPFIDLLVKSQHQG